MNKKYYINEKGLINTTEGTPIEEKVLHTIQDLSNFLDLRIYTISYWNGNNAKIVRVDRKTVHLPINTVELCNIIVA